MCVKRLVAACCNVGYDLLTIFISIADVTTDVIVLVDFYMNSRMVFFGISLTILILAQCSYAMAFSARFDIIDNYGGCLACLCFCCLLPFGSFVAFCIYLSSDDTAIPYFKDCMNVVFGDTEYMFSNNPTDSQFTKWIKKKLDKHIGFILEAGIEAFPQSLLQIIAIVYFQEANYVSIISILISMFSVMTKSLILSQGAERYTFVWTWLCMVADFFGIFFILTWVFYAHESIEGNYLGYFNIFGFIWICKISVSVLFPVSLGLLAFFGYGFWYMMYEEYDGTGVGLECCGFTILWIVFAPLLAVLCAFATCIGLEVFCFAFCAVFVYFAATTRIQSYEKESVGKIINDMLGFISSGNRKERKLRVLSINYGLHQVQNKSSFKLSKYIDETLKEDESGKYDKLKGVTYKDIRENCASSRHANLCRDIRMSLVSECSEVSDCDNIYDILAFMLWTLIMFIILPIFLLAKLLQILFPWIILIYLIYNNLLLLDGEIDTFQLTMLGFELLLQIILISLSMYIYRINYWLWHINPASNNCVWKSLKSDEIMRHSVEFYNNIQWLPQINKTIMSIYGQDIATLIMHYVNNIEIDETDSWSDNDWNIMQGINSANKVIIDLLFGVDDEMMGVTNLKSKIDSVTSNIEHIQMQIINLNDAELKSKWKSVAENYQYELKNASDQTLEVTQVTQVS